MQLYQYSIMAGLAIVMVIMSATTASAKGPSCCTRVSIEEIKVPILNYYFQNGKPPCVPAFVFETEMGRICSAPKWDWVRRTIRELRSLLALKNNSTTTGSPMTTHL